MIDQFVAWCGRHWSPATREFYRTRLRVFRAQYAGREFDSLAVGQAVRVVFRPAEGGVERLMNVYVSMGVTPPLSLPKGAKRALANGVNASGPMPIGLFPINEALPKQHFTVKIEDVQLECYYNNNLTSRSANTRLPHTGTFVLDVNGTVTLEAPRCTGH